MILVWGSREDAPVARVLEALAAVSSDTLHLADASLAAMAYDLRLSPRPSGWLDVGGWRTRVRDIEGVYLRPGEQTGQAASTASVLLSVADSVEAIVVNRPAACRSNLSKPFQLSLLAAAGLATPDTLVTSDVAAARDFLAHHGRIVYKSISGCRSIVSAIDSTSSDQLDRIGHGPVQLQQWVDGLDVRVHIVGDRWFATSVASSATDYRYAAAEVDAVDVAAFDLPADLGRVLVSLARGMGLLLAGVDLRHGRDGAWTCFEVNPSPGFTYYEDQTGQPISAAVAQLLVSAARRPARTTRQPPPTPAPSAAARASCRYAEAEVSDQKRSR